MTLNKLEPGALIADQVFDAIHQGITNGDLAAGQRLRIRDLADQLGTSVMPVRDAIRRLEESGLVETIPYRGAVVRTFTARELLNVYAVRRILEVEAAKLGVAHLGKAEVAVLKDQYDSMKAALADGDLAACLAFDEKFLSTIYLASANPVLHESIERLWIQCRAYKLIGARRAVAEGKSRLLWEFQSKLLKAVKAQDADLMAELTDQSILAAMERIRQALPAATQS